MTTRSSRQRHAFTLIELLVVVAIIALLIAILLPSLNSARQVAARTKGGANLQAIGRAFAAYITEWNGDVPLNMRGEMTSTGTDNGWRFGLRSEGTWPKNSLPPVRLTDYIGGGPRSPMWISPGANVKNPFDVPLYNSSSDPTAWYTRRIANNSLWGSKSTVMMAYFFFVGDPGSLATQQLYTDPSFSTVYFGLDKEGSYKRAISYKPDDLFMQDLAYQDSANLYQANFTKSGTTLSTYYFTGGAGTTIINSSSNFQNYIQGFNITDVESQIAGVNALYADYSVQWKPTKDLRKIYYNGSSGTGMLLLGTNR